LERDVRGIEELSEPVIRESVEPGTEKEGTAVAVYQWLNLVL
jgi:hypothetical protein